MTTDHMEDSERQPLLDHRDRDTNETRIQDEENSRPSKLKQVKNIPQQVETSRLAALEALPWYKRPSIGWLLPFVFLLALVMGISQAPQEQLIIKIICKEHFRERGGALLLEEGEGGMTPLLSNGTSFSPFSLTRGGDDDPCNMAEVQALAALVLGRIRSLKYITGLFTIGFLTSLSDKYGRKALIYITLVPALMTQLLIVYMARPSSDLGIEILYADALFMGLMGAGLLLEPALNAYVADCTPREGRSLAIGYVMVPLAVGLTCGPFFGAFLIEWTDNINTAILVSATTLFFLSIYAIFLPESLPRHARAKSNEDEDEEVAARPKGSLMKRMRDGVVAILDPLLLFLPGGIEPTPDVNVPPSRYTILMLIVGYGFVQFAFSGASIILIPYTNLVFNWGTFKDGVYYSLSGAATFVVYVWIFPGLQKLYKIHVAKEDPNVVAGVPEPTSDHFETRDGDGRLEDNPTSATTGSVIKSSVWSDLTFFNLGSIIYVVGYLIIPLVETEASFLIACCVRALASIGLPSFTSLLTSYVSTNETGKVLGGVCVVDTLMMTLSSLLFGWVFAETSETMPSAVFAMSAAFTCGGVLMGLLAWLTYKRFEWRR